MNEPTPYRLLNFVIWALVVLIVIAAGVWLLFEIVERIDDEPGLVRFAAAALIRLGLGGG